MSNNLPQVSLAMSCLNAEDYIEASIKSILATE